MDGQVGFQVRAADPLGRIPNHRHAYVLNMLHWTYHGKEEK